MARKCSTCQHIKRAEIDRRIAAGEPGGQIARDYDLNPSSLQRHRTNCTEACIVECDHEGGSRGTAAVACLPTKHDLSTGYFDLRSRIDQIITQAEQQGSLQVALSGLNSFREYLGIAAGGEASPFGWDLCERATRIHVPLVPAGTAFAPPAKQSVPVANPFRHLQINGAFR